VRSWVLFDWGDTLMRVLDYPGPMRSWPKVEAIPGAWAALKSLEGRIGIALATNAADSQEWEIRDALGAVGLEGFVDRIYCFKSVGHRKSSPPFFAHVLKDLGLPAGQLVMVGDDFEQDVTAAIAMGMRAVWFNERTEEIRTGEGFQTVRALAELPDVLTAWGMTNPE